ncbi:MAG: hypothetical protein ACKVTZ_01395 [Bacteroidia bacterium]
MKFSAIFTFFFLCFSLMFVGCSTNPETVLPSKTGKWNVTWVSTTTTSSGSTSDTEKTTQTFKDDGTATSVDSDGNTTNFKWAYDESAKKMTVTITLLVIGDVSTVYDVTEQKWNKQTWSRTYKGVLNQDIKDVVTLERAK